MDRRDIDEKLRKLEKAFKEGRISKETYRELKQSMKFRVQAK